MFKLLGLLVVLTGVFGLGYYAGQNGIGDLRGAAVKLSRDAFDTALGMGLERNLQWRTDLIEAKASVVAAKSDLIDRNYGNASLELAKALDAVHAASRKERDPQRVEAAQRLAGKIRETKISMTAGKPVSRIRLDEIQHDVDRLLDR
jgi:hypothetical protein